MGERAKLKDSSEIFSTLEKTVSGLGGQGRELPDRHPLDFGKYAIPFPGGKEERKTGDASPDQDEIPEKPDASAAADPPKGLLGEIQLKENLLREEEVHQEATPQEETVLEFAFEELEPSSVEPSSMEPRSMESASMEEAKEPEPEEFSFRDTLAEKFMKERERYLQELGIAPEKKKPPRKRRVLDTPIQPEMHTQQSDMPANGVTYNRAATVQTLEDPGEIPGLDREETPSRKTKQREKSSEELLLELAALQKATPTRSGGMRGQGTRKGAGRIGQSGGKRIILASAVIGFAALSLVAWGLFLWQRGTAPAVPEDRSFLDAGETQQQGGTLSVYDDHRSEERLSYEHVLIKQSQVTVENLEVEKLVLLEDIGASGGVVLSGMEIGEGIHLKTGGVHTLDLEDVRTERVVVQNDQHTVTVRLGAGTVVDTLEAKTAVVVEQAGEGSLRKLLLRPNPGETLHVRLEQGDLEGVAAEGQVVLELEDSRVEWLSAQGPLSLSGAGRVGEIDAAYAGEDGVLALIIEGVEVSGLRLESPADVRLDSRVERLYARDNLNLSGGGSVGGLSLNGRDHAPRLELELSDVTVNTVTAGAEAQLRSGGSSLVNTLIANHPVYSMGNKVSHLVANASGVIYEEEPDRITVAEGAKPPTPADPDEEWTPLVEEGEEEAGGDAATTCEHTREEGGFLLGTGTASDPYVVSTPAQLAHVNAHLDAHYVQTADIDLAEDSRFTAGFSPIGTATPFTGIYDGGGFSVKNLRIEAGTAIGLFAENAGVIRNLHLASGELSAAAGTQYLGGLVGLNHPEGVLSACSNGARISGLSNAYAGGVAGYNNGGRIRNCYNYAKVSGGGTMGGVTGANRQEGTVVSSYNAGLLEDGGTVGSVAGINESSTVTNCYYLAETAEKGIGSGQGTATQVTSEQLRGTQMIADLSVGDESSPWSAGTGSYGYPMLRIPEGERPEAR